MAGIVLAVHGTLEFPHRAVGQAGLGGRPGVNGVVEAVRLEVGTEEVLRVQGEPEDDGGGEDRADGALRGDGGRGDDAGLV